MCVLLIRTPLVLAGKHCYSLGKMVSSSSIHQQDAKLGVWRCSLQLQTHHQGRAKRQRVMQAIEHSTLLVMRFPPWSPADIAG